MMTSGSGSCIPKTKAGQTPRHRLCPSRKRDYLEMSSNLGGSEALTDAEYVEFMRGGEKMSKHEQRLEAAEVRGAIKMPASLRRIPFSSLVRAPQRLLIMRKCDIFNVRNHSSFCSGRARWRRW